MTRLSAAGGPRHSGGHCWRPSPSCSAAALEDVFGWELLQIGAWGTGRELLRGSRTRRQSLLTLPSFPAGADIIARPSQLPVMSDCIDAVLLPHTLEFAADPYAILREVDRVLVGEGQLLRARVPAAEPVGHARALAAAPAFRRACGACSRSGACATGWCCSATRWSPSSAISTSGPGAGGLAEAEGTGRLLRAGLTYPLPGGAYLLKARKRVYTLTPIRPRAREQGRGDRRPGQAHDALVTS